ncbi:basic proline-rich protein-like [Sus scrofa]|uniref:basic proline-rich protein-like n=1 Tax=Sus scrofa TaxID=9823 RepID=UPI000A2B2295|nr:basic proline-rich protein-like [Sus scrofa]
MDLLCCAPISRGRSRRRGPRGGNLIESSRRWISTQGRRLRAFARRGPESPPPEPRQELGEEGRRSPVETPPRPPPRGLSRAHRELRTSSSGTEDRHHLGLRALDGLAPPEAQPEAPAGDPQPEAKTPPGQEEPAASLAPAPDTDGHFPPLEENGSPAPAGDQGPQENPAAALQEEPALPAPAAPRLSPELAQARAPGQFPKPPSPKPPPPLQVPSLAAAQKPHSPSPPPEMYSPSPLAICLWMCIDFLFLFHVMYGVIYFMF